MRGKSLLKRLLLVKADSIDCVEGKDDTREDDEHLQAAVLTSAVELSERKISAAQPSGGPLLHSVPFPNFTC